LHNLEKAVTGAHEHKESAQMMLANIKELSGVSDCILFSLAGSKLRVVAHTSRDELLPVDTVLNREDTVAWGVLETGKPLLIKDLRREGLRLDRIAAGKQKYSSALYMPLVYRDQPLGVLALGFDEADYDALSIARSDALNALAAQAALILDGMLLLEQAEKRVQRLKELKDLASAAASTLELEILAQSALDVIHNWTICRASVI
jgi:transcriptional regulator with GAF, ATPase, and Fis domain